MIRCLGLINLQLWVIMREVKPELVYSLLVILSVVNGLLVLVNCDYFLSGGRSCVIACVGLGIRGVMCGLSGLFINNPDSWIKWDLGA